MNPFLWWKCLDCLNWNRCFFFLVLRVWTQLVDVQHLIYTGLENWDIKAHHNFTIFSQLTSPNITDLLIWLCHFCSSLDGRSSGRWQTQNFVQSFQTCLKACRTSWRTRSSRGFIPGGAWGSSTHSYFLCNVFFIKSLLFFTAKNSKVFSFCLKTFPSQFEDPYFHRCQMQTFHHLNKVQHPNIQEPCL